MAIQIDYFLAADDAAAAATATLETGPRTESFDMVGSNEVDPGLALGYLHEIVMGMPLESFLEEHPPTFVASSADEQKLVLELDPAVATFLAALPQDPDQIADLATRWAAHPAPEEADAWTPRSRDLGDFLVEIRELARRGAERGQSVYCWLWP